MPLNSERLPKDALNYLRELPLDRECANDLFYQTKVEIYENKCKGCGFAKIVLITQGNDNRQRSCSFEGTDAIDKANDALGKNIFDVIRTCVYPNDITIKNGQEEYPSLSEIVSNTCQFWNIDKLNIPADNETSFTEVEEIQLKVEKMVDKWRANIYTETISEK